MTDAPKDHRSQDVLAYKQGFLEGEELAEFEAHLRDCAACQATLERVSRFLPALQQALTMEQRSTAELWAATKAEFAAKQQHKKPRRSLVAVRLWLSAAAVSMATAIFFVARPLLMAAGPELAVKPVPDAGHRGGYLAAPHRPEPEGVDGGMDAGEGEPTSP